MARTIGLACAVFIVVMILYALYDMMCETIQEYRSIVKRQRHNRHNP